MQLSLHHIKSLFLIADIVSEHCITTIVFTKTVVASLSASEPNLQNDIGSVEYSINVQEIGFVLYYYRYDTNQQLHSCAVLQ